MSTTTASTLASVSLATRLARLQPALAHAASRPPSATGASAFVPSGTRLADQLSATARTNHSAALVLLRDPAEAVAATSQTIRLLQADPAAVQTAHAGSAESRIVALLAS